MKRIVVEISGGAVQAVYLPKEMRGKVEVVLADHDEYEALGMTGEQADKAAKRLTKGLTPTTEWGMDQAEDVREKTA